MTNDTHPQIQTSRRPPRIACMVTLAVALATAMPRAAQDDHDRGRPLEMPENIEVPEGNKLYFVGRAFGTQNYICLPSSLPTSNGFAWTLFGPQANLFTDHDRQVMTHFLSPNPDEGGLLRATWQHSDDTSAVWARMIATSSDPAYVAPGAIPWLKLEVVGAQRGPRNGGAVTDTTFIQRLNTTGGVAPATGCAAAADVGVRTFAPYTADYAFYKRSGRHHRN